MKYIKTFEKKQKRKYKKGDYVLVYSEFEKIYNAIMQIESYWYDEDKLGKPVLIYDCRYVCHASDSDLDKTLSSRLPIGFCGSGVFEEDIVRKLTAEEVKFYTDVKKI